MRVNGKLCRIFRDAGSVGRYAASTVIQNTKAKYFGNLERRIQVFLHSTKKNFQQFELKITIVDGDFNTKIWDEIKLARYTKTGESQI